MSGLRWFLNGFLFCFVVLWLLNNELLETCSQENLFWISGFVCVFFWNNDKILFHCGFKNKYCGLSYRIIIIILGNRIFLKVQKCQVFCIVLIVVWLNDCGRYKWWTAHWIFEYFFLIKHHPQTSSKECQMHFFIINLYHVHLGCTVRHPLCIKSTCLFV